MNFEEAHASFIQYHLQRRMGERKGRLDRSHWEAEKLFCRNVWLPLRGHFDELHPEFEVLDWRGKQFDRSIPGLYSFLLVRLSTATHSCDYAGILGVFSGLGINRVKLLYNHRLFFPFQLIG